MTTIGQEQFRARAWTLVNEQRMVVIGLEAQLQDAQAELGRRTQHALSMQNGVTQLDLEELIG